MNTRYWSALAVTTALLLPNAQAQVVKLEFEGRVGSSYDYAGNLTGSQGHDVVNGRSILVQVAWESDAGAFDGFNFSGPHSWLTTRVLLDGTLLTHDVSEVDMTGWPNGTIDRNNPHMHAPPVDILALGSGFEPECYEYIDADTHEPAIYCYGPSSYMAVNEYEVVSAYQWDTNNTPEHGSEGYDDLFGLYGPEFWASVDFFQTKTFWMEAYAEGWNFASSNELDADFDFSGDFYWSGSLAMAYGRGECTDWQLALGCRNNDEIVPEYQNFELTFSGHSARVGWSTDPVSVNEGHWGPVLLFSLLPGWLLRRRRGTNG